jgi:hypothetical protein
VTSGSKVFGQANSVESGLLENLPGHFSRGLSFSLFEFENFKKFW